MSAARMVALAALLGCAALLGLIGYRLVRPGVASGVAGAPGVNASGRAMAVDPRPAPEVALRTFGGERIRLSELRGRVVVLNFWSSWCPPCKDEAPELERLWRRYEDRGVVLLGVNVWDDGQAARNFLAEQGITYPNGIPEGRPAVEYGLTGIPETFVVDGRGRLVGRWNGPLTAAQLSGLIDAVPPR